MILKVARIVSIRSFILLSNQLKLRIETIRAT